MESLALLTAVELERMRVNSFWRATRVLTEAREARTEPLRKMLTDEYESEKEFLDTLLAEEKRRRESAA